MYLDSLANVPNVTSTSYNSSTQTTDIRSFR